jgi:Protein of unknown function (DUF2968)
MNSKNTSGCWALVLAWFVLSGAACGAAPKTSLHVDKTRVQARSESSPISVASANTARASVEETSPIGNGAASESEVATNSSVADLQNLIRDGKVQELRTTYNGSYGTSMLFCRDEMTFYVALFQQKKFWRVVRTQDDKRAEGLYENFGKSTAMLAEAEIHRTKLEAEKDLEDRLIAAQQGRANRLQADLDVARVQQAQVAERQEEVQDAIRTLRTQQDAAQVQLRAWQAKVNNLQRQSEGDLAHLPK